MPSPAERPGGPRGDLLIGIDAGTSVIKAVAFTLAGAQVAAASVPNRVDAGPGGAATQPMERTWHDCAAALRALGDRVTDLAGRTAALLAGIPVDLQPTGWRLTERGSRDGNRARDLLARDLDALEDAVAGGPLPRL